MKTEFLNFGTPSLTLNLSDQLFGAAAISGPTASSASAACNVNSPTGASTSCSSSSIRSSLSSSPHSHHHHYSPVSSHSLHKSGSTSVGLVPHSGIPQLMKKVVDSLYYDRILPDMHSIKHRMCELLEVKEPQGAAVDATLRDLVISACRRNDVYVVLGDPIPDYVKTYSSPLNDSKGADWIANVDANIVTSFSKAAAVVLKKCPKNFSGFVDPHGADTFNEQMWEGFSAYLLHCVQSGETESYSFHRGRYSAAKTLKERDLTFFKGFSVGELVKVVQLAMSKHKLLMFDDDKTIRPPVASAKVARSVVGLPSPKRNSVEIFDGYNNGHYGSDGGHNGASLSVMPVFSTLATDRNFINSWSDLRQCLLKIFSIYPGGVSLCRLKNLIQCHYYGRVLSETAFRYTRLSDLMKSEELSDVCVLEKVDCMPSSLYMIRPSKKDNDYSSSFSKSGSMDESTVSSSTPAVQLEEDEDEEVEDEYVNEDVYENRHSLLSNELLVELDLI